MITIGDAIHAINSDAVYEHESTIDSIIWRENTNPIKPSAIQAKIAELQADYDAKQYQRDRAAAYPSWQDQLDTIYHQGIDVWKTQIKAIKDQHPKP